MAGQEFEKFREEIQHLISEMPVSICKMTEWQIQTCTLFLLYDINKTLKHLDRKLTSLQKVGL